MFLLWFVVGIMNGSSIFRQDWVKVSLWLVGTMVLGALLAPWIFVGGKEFAAWVAAGGEARQGIPFVGWVGKMADHADFKRYFNRAMLVAALVLLWPLVRSMRGGGGAPKGLRLEKNHHRFGYLAVGWCFASVILLAMGFSFVGVGFFTMRGDPAWGEWLTTALIAGFGAAVMEEVFFRGLLTGVLLRKGRPLAVMIFVTIFFAIVHFLKPPEGLRIPNETVDWQSGFHLTGIILRHMLEPQFLLAEFATLFAVGWVLMVARMKTKSLWLSIGLHGGWVFGLKLFSACTRRDAPLSETLPWIGNDLKTGVVPLVLVSATGILVMLVTRGWRKSPALENGAK